MYALMMQSGAIVGHMSLVSAVLKFRQNANVLAVVRLSDRVAVLVS